MKNLKKVIKPDHTLLNTKKQKVLSERTQQLSNGADSFLKNPESYSCVDENSFRRTKMKVKYHL